MEMRDVVGYEDYYAVTDDGRVWSKKSQKFMTLFSLKDGYLRVTLTKEGNSKQVMVHRLVCEAFNGPSPGDDYIVDHIDANRANPSASNLRWLTKSGNNQHALEMGNVFVRPVIGFSEDGDVIRFPSVSAARKAGFGGVSESLSRKKFLCKGYAFVYEEEWETIVPSVYFEQMEEVRARRKAAEVRKGAESRTIDCAVRGTSVIDGDVVVFPTIKAAKEAGYTSVALCLKGRLKTCGKRTWEALGEYEPRTYRRRSIKGLV